ncbi:hypothetical protein F6X59_11580 [Pseudomonas sp. MN1F]|nr:hypothetical protein [Pseudomonas sp. MN1F]
MGRCFNRLKSNSFYWGATRGLQGRKTISLNCRTFLPLPGNEPLARGFWLFLIGVPFLVHFHERKTTNPGCLLLPLLFTVSGSTMVLLHGFIKKSQKTPAFELETARQRKAALEKYT